MCQRRFQHGSGLPPRRTLKGSGWPNGRTLKGPGALQRLEHFVNCAVSLLEAESRLETLDFDRTLALQSIWAERRSIRRLRGGVFTPEMLERLLVAVRLTPAAYGLPPWRVVLVHER